MATESVDVADYNRDVDVVIEIVTNWFPTLEAEEVEDCAAEVIDVIHERWSTG